MKHKLFLISSLFIMILFMPFLVKAADYASDPSNSGDISVKFSCPDNEFITGIGSSIKCNLKIQFSEGTTGSFTYNLTDPSNVLDFDPSSDTITGTTETEIIIEGKADITDDANVTIELKVTDNNSSNPEISLYPTIALKATNSSSSSSNSSTTPSTNSNNASSNQTNSATSNVVKTESTVTNPNTSDKNVLLLCLSSILLIILGSLSFKKILKK